MAKWKSKRSNKNKAKNKNEITMRPPWASVAYWLKVIANLVQITKACWTSLESYVKNLCSNFPCLFFKTCGLMKI